MKSKAESIDSYRFMSDDEPTEIQLGLLMKEVAIDVRKRAEIANNKFQEDLRLLCLKKVSQLRIK